LFVNTYILYTETPRPNTNRNVHVHKCLHCAGIEPATSCVVGEYSHHYASRPSFETWLCSLKQPIFAYADKGLDCPEIEPATSSLVDEYSHHYAKSAIRVY
jgi:hypothetical protein